MNKPWLLLLVLLFAAGLAGCAGAPLAATNQPEAISPEPTLTSVFEPMLTPTPTPYKDTPTVVVPPADALPGVTIPTLASGQVITPTMVDFIDPLVGWGVIDSADSAVSGYIVRTEDGGSTWQAVNPKAGFPQYSRFFALDALQAWAVPADFRPGETTSAAYTWRTSDGGKSWQASNPVDLAVQDEPVEEYNFPMSVFFLDAQHGWFVVSVGHYMNQDVLEIYSTQDGGQTWQRTADKFSMGQNGTAPMPCLVSGIAFVDPQHGFLAGNCLAVGVNDGWSILESKDGGHTWQRIQLPEPAGVPDIIRSGMDSGNVTCAVMDVRLTPAGVLFQDTCQVMDAAGGIKAYPFLYLSPDGGSTWRGWAGQSASFLDQNTGFSLGSINQAGARELLSTTDGGQTWQVVTLVTWPEAQLNFVTIHEGFVLASGWNTQRGAFDYALVRTQDGGKSWELVQSTIR